jgi:hypothetical protein
MAQSLQDLLSVIIQSDPVAAARISQEVNPTKIVDEIQYLRGAGNIKRFRYTPEEQQQMALLQREQVNIEKDKNRVKPTISLAGKLTPEQEAAIASAAIGTPTQPGPSQDGIENVIAQRAKPVSPNGAGTK